jgi:hypothetical protein
MKFVCGMGLILLVAANVTQAQYRSGQPPVLDAPAAAPDDNSTSIISAFRLKYSTAKQPRIALFWNRDLSDDIARQTYEKSTTNSTKSDSETSAGGSNNKNDEKLEQANSTTIKSVVTVTDNQHGAFDPRSDALLKTTFVEAMRNGGVRFIDHSVMVRTAAAEAGGNVDPQINEIKALQSKADWLMEITLVPDANAPLGQGFRIAVKDVSSGMLITELYTPAIPPPRGPGGYMAVNGGNGFVEAPRAPITVREVGYTLGIETMGQLVNVL